MHFLRSPLRTRSLCVQVCGFVRDWHRRQYIFLSRSQPQQFNLAPEDAEEDEALAGCIMNDVSDHNLPNPERSAAESATVTPQTFSYNRLKSLAPWPQTLCKTATVLERFCCCESALLFTHLVRLASILIACWGVARQTVTTWQRPLMTTPPGRSDDNVRWEGCPAMQNRTAFVVSRFACVDVYLSALFARANLIYFPWS